jgi:ribosome maturation factor RimP
MDLSALKAALRPAVEQLGYELYDVELAKERKTHILRVTIDKPDGIAIEDCVAVNDVLSPLLDALDPIADDYNLEVSSPGAERKLRNPAEILASVGRFVHVEANGVKTEGVLLSADPDSITLSIGTKPTVIATKAITLIRHAIKF